jgi:hypothetical protein
MMGYKRLELDETDLCHLMVNKHAHLISGLMEKYGIVSYTIVCSTYHKMKTEKPGHWADYHQTHNASKPSSLLSQLFDPKRVAFSDHDFVVQITFPDIENFLKLKSDPIYLERLAQDHRSFSDPSNEARKTRYDSVA